MKVLVDKGFVHEPEAAGAIDALAVSGLLESAMVQAAVAEAEDMLARQAQRRTPATSRYSRVCAISPLRR